MAGSTLALGDRGTEAGGGQPVIAMVTGEGPGPGTEQVIGRDSVMLHAMYIVTGLPVLKKQEMSGELKRPKT